MKKLTRDRVVPIISARDSCVICGIIVSGSPGSPNSAINNRIRGKPFFAGVEKLIDEIGLSSHTTGEQKLQEQIGKGVLFVHNANHFRPLDLECSTGGNGRGRGQSKAAAPAIDSSPMKSPAESSVMVASFPLSDTTVILARPF